MSDSIKISIELADKAANKALNDMIGNAGRAEVGLKKVGEAGKSSFNGLSLNINQASQAMGSFIGNLAADGVGFALDSLRNAAGALFQTFIVDGVKAAQEEEAALNKLAFAMKLTGEFSEAALSEFQDFASGLQGTTKFADDAIFSQLALAKTFGATNEQAKLLVQAALDLSTATGTDLETATTQLGGTLNGTLGKLGKYNEGLKGLTAEQLRSGEAARILGEQFKGSAASDANTFAGAILKTKNAFGDLQEATGRAITENPTIVSAFNELTKILGGTAEEANSSGLALKILVSQGFLGLIQGAQVTVVAFDSISRAIDAFGNGVLVVNNQIAAGIFKILDVMSLGKGGYDKYYQGFAQAAQDAALKIDQAISGDTFLSEVGTKLAEIEIAAQKGFDAMLSGATVAAPAVQGATNKVVELSDAQKKLNDEMKSYAEGLAKQGASIDAEYSYRLQALQNFNSARNLEDTDADRLNYEEKILRDQEFYAAQQVLLEEQLFAESTKLSEARAKKLVDEQTYLAAQEELNKKYAQKTIALQNDLKLRNKRDNDAKKKQDEEYHFAKLQATSQVFGALGSILAIGGKKNFEIVKALNLAEATTSGVLAVQRALALGPPLGIPAAIGAGAMAAANVARIASTKVPAFEQGGIVPGNSFSGDRVTARVNSGEMILNTGQQAQLFKMANGDGGGNAKVDQLVSMVGDLLRQPLMVSIDGKELINITRAQLASGRAF